MLYPPRHSALFRLCWLLVSSCWLWSACQPPDGSCQADKDCQGGRCIQQKCLAAGTCSQDSHCLFGQICQNQACVAFRCSKDTECKETQSCHSGTCLERVKRGGNCTKDGPLCQLNHTCITLTSDNQGACFKDCTTDASRCGDETCIPFARHYSGKTISVCLKEVPKGAACGYRGEQQNHCQRGMYPPLYCNPLAANTCAPAIVRQGILEFCTLPNARDNDEWLLCEEFNGLYCDIATRTCQKTDNIVGEGEDCDLTGQRLGRPTLCVRGARCLSFNQEGSLQRCAFPCRPQEQEPCPIDPTLQCAPIYQDGTGICTQSCQQDSDCRHNGYTCRPQTDGKGICLPDFPTGPVGIGGLCTPPSPQGSCKAGLFCLKIVEATGGFCSKECTSDSDCPATKDPQGATIGGECVSTNGAGAKACVYPCEQQTCPLGLACIAFGAKRCFAP